MDNILKKLQRVVLAGLLSIGIFATSAANAGMFTTSGFAELLLIDVTSSTGSLDGLSIDGLDFSDFGTDLFAPPADADASADVSVFADPLGIGVGFNTTLESLTSGSGNAFAFADATMLVEISNSSVSSDFELVYSLTWDLEATADLISPALDSDAFSEVFFDATAEIFGGDSDSEADFVSADALLGPPFDAASGSADIFLTLTPGDFAVIDIVLSGVGESAFVPLPAQVPAPPALMLLIFGLGFLGRRRRQP